MLLPLNVNMALWTVMGFKLPLCYSPVAVWKTVGAKLQKTFIVLTLNINVALWTAVSVKQLPVLHYTPPEC